MIKTAAVAGLVLFVSVGPVAQAQSPAPQAYRLKAEGTIGDRKLTVTVERDGPRERVEMAIDQHAMVSLYDFEAHRVYWIGWSGAGSCSSGKYTSARAPADQDPVTGTVDNLVTLAEGRKRQPAGTGVVGGRPAHVEAFVGGKKPTGPDASPWPKRVWLADDGGYLLKLEAEGPGGKPVTLMEVTQLTFGKPEGATLQPPSECISTDSVMDDSGSIRSHAEASVEVKATGSVDLGTGATSATVTQAEGKAARPPAPGALSKLGGVTLSAVEQPHPGPCGTKLQLTGTLTVDGPATIWYRFQPYVGGVQFPDGQIGTVTVDGAGTTTVVKDALLPRSLKGTLRLQASVQGTKGHNGPLKLSDPVSFQVTCAGK